MLNKNLVDYSTTTEELAEAIELKPQSLRKHYNQKGSYYGIVPVKLPNRRLLWPNNAKERLLSGGIA